MFRAYILISDIDPTMFEDFVSFISDVYGMSGLPSGPKNNHYYLGVHGAYLFELGLDDAQQKAVFRWFSERRQPHTSPMCLVIVNAGDDLMKRTVNVSDVAPEMLYPWDKFVSNVVLRFSLE